MIVVVGGQCRHVGKTQAVCDIIAATREAEWVAVKLTPHAHESEEGSQKDTARYLSAGAAAAHLITRGPGVQLPPARNLIVESNSILDQLEPDVFFLLVDPDGGDWKPSAVRQASHPRAVRVTGALTQDHIAMVRAGL